MKIFNNTKRTLSWIVVIVLMLGLLSPGVTAVAAAEEPVNLETEITETIETNVQDAQSDTQSDEGAQSLNDIASDTENEATELETTQENASPSDAPQGDSESTTVQEEIQNSAEIDVESVGVAQAAMPMRVPANESDALADFLDYGSILIDGMQQDLNGPITVTENSTYDVTLHFAEDPEGKQFSTTMHYSFPEGFVALDTSGSFNLNVSDGSNTYQVKANYSINGNALTVSFDPDENSTEAWNALMASSDCEFSINLSGKISARTTELIWIGTTTTDVTVNPEAHNLNIIKDGVFNVETRKLDYTLTITSTGSNTNVIVTDAHIGTAIAFDKTSGVTASPSTGSLTSSSADGFVYTIPSMSDGDVIKLTYSAAVDFDHLTGAGTVDETKNTAKVKSDEHTKEEEDSFDFEHKISFSSLEKRSLSVADGEGGHKTVSWLITSNKETLVPMAGKIITDTIDEGSTSIMTYGGTGIHVVVKNSADEIVRSEDISWSELTNKTDSSWTYTIPANDTKPYQYEILYVTDVDANGLLSDTNVKNKSGDSDGNTATGEAKIKVTEGSKLDVNKEAVEVDYEHITWKVTLDIPASGLTSAMVHDSLPTAMLSGEYLVDKLMSESVTVEGLLEGESYTGPTIVENGRGVDFTFSGLRGTGSARQIVITFSTKNNVAWLNQALADPSNYYKHTNKVRFTGNGTYAEDTDYGIPIKPSVTKEAREIQKASDGMPMYAYLVTVTGLTGDLDITDTFDTSVLEYASEETGDVTGYGTPGHIYGGDLACENHDSNGTATISTTATGITIHMDEANLATHSGGKKFTQYKVVYVLKVKDAAALEELNKKAIASENGTVVLNNTATAPGIGEASATVSYEYNAIDKELLETVVPTDGSRPYATYRIVINPEARDLDPDSDTLVMRDTYSNTLSLDYSSVIIEPSDNVTYDVSGNTATYRVPDNTKITITYRAWIVGTGALTISNEAKLLGYSSDTTSTKVEVNASGGGSASVHSINVYKHKSGDMGTPLAGATFALYIKKNASGEWVPVVNGDGNAVSFTTDATGYVKIMGNQQNEGWTLIKGRQYYLVETQSPYGYLEDTIHYQFSLSDHPDYANYVYMDGDILKIRNYPSIAEVTPQVKKIVSGEGAPDETFTFKIEPAGGVTLPSEYHSTAEAKDGETAVFETLEFSEPGTYTYEINEIVPESPTPMMHYMTDKVVMTVTVSADDEGLLHSEVKYNGAAEAAVITNTYGNEPAEGKLRIVKVDAADNTTVLAGAVFTIKDAEGNFVAEITTDAQGEAEYTLPYGMYILEEKIAPSGYKLNSEPITVSVDNELVKLPIQNSIITQSIHVRKQWVGGTADSVTIHLLADGADTPKTLVLDAASGWEGDFEDLPVYDGNGNEIAYTIREDGITDFSTSITGDTQNGFTVTNTKHETPNPPEPQSGSLIVSKDVSGGGGDLSRAFSFTVSLDHPLNGNYGDMLFIEGIATFTLKHGESKTAADLPAGTRYSVEESDNTGYTVRVNGTAGTTASGTILSGETVSAAFNNYRPEDDTPSVPIPAKVKITATKTLDGTAPKGNGFVFVLKDSTGAVVQTKNNDGGSISFDEMQFSQIGTYVYTLGETAGADEKITYDTTVYTIVIDVSRSGDYHASVSYLKNGEAFTGVLSFANKTKTPPSPNPGPGQEGTRVSVSKVWDDNNSSRRPDAVTIQLYRNGDAYGDAVSLNAGNNWHYEWNSLDAGYSWTVDEVNVPSGYTRSVAHDGNVWTITNSARAIASVPKTGDNSNLVLWCALAFSSLLGMTGLLICRRHTLKRKER